MRSCSHIHLTWLTVVAMPSLAPAADLNGTHLEFAALADASAEQAYGDYQQTPAIHDDTRLDLAPSSLPALSIDTRLDSNETLTFTVLEYVRSTSIADDRRSILNAKELLDQKGNDWESPDPNPWNSRTQEQDRFSYDSRTVSDREGVGSGRTRRTQLKNAVAKSPVASEIVPESTFVSSLFHYSAPVLAIAAAIGIMGIVLRKY